MQTTNDQPKTKHWTDEKTNESTDRRVTVAEAAILLEISEDAVRSRLKRGTLKKEKARDGTVLVILGPGGSFGRPAYDTDRISNQPTTGESTDEFDGKELIEMLREQVSFLRQQLEKEREVSREEREANRENRRIIAGLMQRVPEIEAAEPSKPRESPVPASSEAGTGKAPPEHKEATERRSWWRRMFGP